MLQYSRLRCDNAHDWNIMYGPQDIPSDDRNMQFFRLFCCLFSGIIKSREKTMQMIKQCKTNEMRNASWEKKIYAERLNNNTTETEKYKRITTSRKKRSKKKITTKSPSKIKSKCNKMRIFMQSTFSAY